MDLLELKFGVKFDEEMYIENFTLPNINKINSFRYLEQYETDYLSKNALFYPIEKKTMADTAEKKLFIKSSNLLRGYFDNKLSTKDVFDIDKLANFFAILDLMSSQHSGECHNLRFYLNPYNSLLEPIGYDGEPLFERKTLSIRMALEDETYDFTPAHKKLFTDTSFVKKYVASLERISSDKYLPNFITKNKKLFDSSFAILCKSFPNSEISFNPILENQKYIQSMLHPTQAVHCFLNKILKAK